MMLMMMIENYCILAAVSCLWITSCPWSDSLVHLYYFDQHIAEINQAIIEFLDISVCTSKGTTFFVQLIFPLNCPW